MGRVRREEKNFIDKIANEMNISKKKAKKRYVTRRKDMSFLDNW